MWLISTFNPIALPAFFTIIAKSPTLNSSVNWLNTRNSPGSAGLAIANSIHRTVSRISKKPRVCPPLP